MDQNSDQIVEQIDRQREELGRDLDELGSRVRRTTDWKAQFDRHPYMFLGAAFGGGLLLSSMVSGGSKTSVNTGVMPYPSYPYSEPDADSYSGYSTARAEDSSPYASPPSNDIGSSTAGTSGPSYGAPSSSYSGASYGSSYGSPQPGASYGSTQYPGSGYGSSYGGQAYPYGGQSYGSQTMSRASRSGSVTHMQREKAMETLDQVKGALIAFAATKAKELLSDLLPGFNRHLDEAQQGRKGTYGSTGRQQDTGTQGATSSTYGSGTSASSEGSGYGAGSSSQQSGYTSGSSYGTGSSQRGSQSDSGSQYGGGSQGSGSTYGTGSSQTGSQGSGSSYGSGSSSNPSANPGSVSGGAFQSPGSSPWSGTGSGTKSDETNAQSERGQDSSSWVRNETKEPRKP